MRCHKCDRFVCSCIRDALLEDMKRYSYRAPDLLLSTKQEPIGLLNHQERTVSPLFGGLKYQIDAFDQVRDLSDNILGELTRVQTFKPREPVSLPDPWNRGLPSHMELQGGGLGSSGGTLDQIGCMGHMPPGFKPICGGGH